MSTSPQPEDIALQIERTFVRAAAYEARRVQVEIREGTVVLTGTVDTFAEREEAGRSAWCVDGVVRVENRLRVTGEKHPEDAA